MHSIPLHIWAWWCLLEGKHIGVELLYFNKYKAKGCPNCCTDQALSWRQVNRAAVQFGSPFRGGWALYGWRRGGSCQEGLFHKHLCDSFIH